MGAIFPLIPYEPLTSLPHFRIWQNGYISSLLVYSQRAYVASAIYHCVLVSCFIFATQCQSRNFWMAPHIRILFKILISLF